MATVSASVNNYEGWTREQLIERLNLLERPRTRTSPPPISRRPRKSFDFSSYPKRKIAIKFCYSGWEYGGLAYQKVPGPLPTVEGVLFDAFAKARLVDVEAGLEGCKWERCGRTDRGVSGGGQVVTLWVRSALTAEALNKAKVPESKLAESSVSIPDITKSQTIPPEDNGSELDEVADVFAALDISESSVNTSIRKSPAGKQRLEHNYVHMLNNILPSTIRVLAWSPVSESFSARFSCVKRHYKYFFLPKGLCITRMQEAASRLIGEHDFRNLCKVDAQKQITMFKRTIISAYIEPLNEGDDSVYVFNLIGSAFLYHQVRHIMSILFLVGTGLEHLSLVTTLMNVEQGVEPVLDGEELYEVVDRKPEYQMADGLPLMLWDCIYREEDLSWRTDNKPVDKDSGILSYKDLYEQLYGIHSKSLIHAALSKHFLLAAAQYHPPPEEVFPIPKEDISRIDEVLAGKGIHIPLGGGTFKRVLKYTPVLKRDRMDTVEVINEKWRLGRGTRVGERRKEVEDDGDE